MATFALPKDNDKDKDKHKDKNHQIHDNKQYIKDYLDAWYDSSTVAFWDFISTSTPSAKEDLMSTMDNLLQVTFFVAIVIIF